MTPEGRVKKIVTDGLKAIRDRHPDKITWRMPVLRGMGKPLLDYVICVAGQFVMIETKRDAKHLITAQQKEIVREFESAGGLVFIVYDKATADDALACVEVLVRYDKGIL
jgi:hypothetical protein